jgi:hypothetical protein
VTIGSHQACVGKSQDHITPKRFIDRLGPFDLDPCAAVVRPWDCAEINWVIDGLIRIWFGLVWLNPPFDRYEVGKWIAKLAEHNNGICLLHARTEAAWFEPIWQHAAAILFMADRSQQILAPHQSLQRLATKHCDGSNAAALAVSWSLNGTTSHLYRYARCSTTARRGWHD